jgi:hypothetical protein
MQLQANSHNSILFTLQLGAAFFLNTQCWGQEGVSWAPVAICCTYSSMKMQGQLVITAMGLHCLHTAVNRVFLLLLPLPLPLLLLRQWMDWLESGGTPKRIRDGKPEGPRSY